MKELANFGQILKFSCVFLLADTFLWILGSFYCVLTDNRLIADREKGLFLNLVNILVFGGLTR